MTQTSCLSIDPLLSVSKLRKQFCQSVTYFHKAPKSESNFLCYCALPVQCHSLTLKVHLTSVPLVEHADHQSHGFLVKRCPRSVRECSLKLVRRNESGTISINPKNNN